MKIIIYLCAKNIFGNIVGYGLDRTATTNGKLLLAGGSRLSPKIKLIYSGGKV